MLKRMDKATGHSGLRHISGYIKFLSWPAALVLLAALFPGFTRALVTPQSDDIRHLAPGVPIEREMAGGQSHAYYLTAGERQYFRVIVEQRGVDVIVSLAVGDGKQLYEVDSPNGTAGTEDIPYVTREAGRYLIIVRCLDQNTKAGKYAIRIEGPRPATALDESRSGGERAMAEAERLRRRNKAEEIGRAIIRFEEAARDFKAAGEARKEIEALYGVGESYYVLGDMPKAKQLAEQVLQLARQAGYRSEESRALTALASAHFSTSDSRKALEYNQQALSIAREMNDVVGEVAVLSNMGATHSQLAEYPQALAYYQQALAIIRNADKSRMDAAVRNTLRENEGFLLSNLCAFHSRLGQMQQALDACQQALPALREVKNARGEGRALSNIALALKRLGQPREALEYNLEAARALGQLGARRDEAIALNDLGLTYVDLGDYARAIAAYEQSLKLAQEAQNRIGEGITRHNLGTAYALTGESAKALTAFEQSLELARATGARESEVGALIALGRLHFRSGDFPTSADFQRQALQLAHAIKLAPQEAAALYYLAETNRALGAVTEALSLSEESLRGAESLRAQVGDSRLRSSFFASVQDRYEFHIDTLMQAHQRSPGDGHDAAALHTFERARARGLLELLAEAQADILQGADPSLLALEKSLQQQLNAKAATQTRLLSGKGAEAQAAALAKEIDGLTTRYQEVRNQIRIASPHYAALTQPQPLTAAEIQKQALDENTLLLEYALGEKKSYLWAVTATTLSGYQLPPRAEIEAAARKVYDLLITRPKRGDPLDPQFIAQAEALSRMLLGPAASQLGKKRLAVVAPGVLSYLPFASLPFPARARATAGNYLPLIAAHEIVNLPSASVLSVIRRETDGRKPASHKIAVLADPVFEANDPRVAQAKNRGASDETPVAPSLTPAGIAEHSSLTRAINAMNFSNARTGFTRLAFSRREAESIFALASGGTGLKATDFNASRALVMSEGLSQYRILHFATHGLLNSERPELSGLVFSLVDKEGKPQDGFLRLHEVYNLRLNADLIVLSACETGLGKEIKGEGLIGLTRGFMHAGAPRVVASLWNVDDLATAELMKLFYQGMLKDGPKSGLAPAAALRAAQFEMSKQKRWASPYFWAGFVLQGEWK